ncbi:N-acetylmuramoyl-L-alanine amidase family protein [Paracoccus niistensis]|uniref:N-acetylmuramoyl-L-alanine amidase n=1 Tax=Paracoccus niistensis TaxID=632935 RepID=A0ABV6I1U7_9RHOB
MVRALRALALALLLAVPVQVGAEALAALDPARTTLGFLGRDRGKPRPLVLTIGLDRAVPHSIAIIDGPPRLVVDLRDTRPPEGAPDGPPSLRWGPAPQGGARAILTLPGPMELKTARMATAPDPALTLHLVPVAPETFRPRSDTLTVLRGLPQPAQTGPGAQELADDRLRVVLDPGHGGFDPGAQAGGITEAAVMLGFAREFAAILRAQGIEVVLTREDDRFIPLERRTTVARAKGADLFISLHADALPEGEAAGATIYTWDGRSNDRAARQLAQRHDRSDLLAGMDLSDTDEDVSRALMDLARIGTQPRSQDAARHLVAKLNEAGVVMHRTPVRGAAFSVLKSPDIPSLLIELGFLTHPDDRANLFDPDWRERVAQALTRGILAWSADRDGQGGAQGATR